jgi:hypothetical protein
LLLIAVVGALLWIGWRVANRAANPSVVEVSPPSAVVDAQTLRDDAAPLDARVSTDAAVQPLEEPASSPAPLGDPSEAELETFARECAPGTIEGIVLRGRDPVAGGSAWLGADSSGGMPWGGPPVWDSDPNVAKTAIGGDGVFRFEGLDVGDYGVGVLTPDGATRHVYLTLQSAVSTRRLRIVLGCGGIRGRVYDARGGPSAGWQVSMWNWGNTLADVQVIDGTTSDAAGAFEFAGLTAGNYVLMAMPATGASPPERRTLYTELLPCEWKTVDFGSVGGSCLWTGRVLSPRGEPLVLMPLTELRVASNTIKANAALDHGRFEIRLAEGNYDLGLFAYVGTMGPVSLGSVAIHGERLERDVTLPGALVRVRPTYAGKRADPADALRSMIAWLDLPEIRWKLTSVRDDRARECFLLVPPGSHTLSCSLPIQGAPGGRMPVTIRESDGDLELDVVVGDP